MEILIQTGFGRRDVTPEWPVPLAGYYNPQFRYHTRVLSHIFVNCTALSDGKTTVLWYSIDMARPNGERFSGLRRAVSEATGVPYENILCCCTHTHASVEPNSREEAVEKWFPIFTEKTIEAARDALADLAPSRAFIGAIETHEMTYTRRYYLKDGSSLCLSKGKATPENPVVRHETTADPMMETIRFVREGKKDICLMNFGCHPTITGGPEKYDLSADYPGRVTQRLEEDGEYHFMFLQAGVGNTVVASRLKETEIYHHDLESYSLRLADYFRWTLKFLHPVELGEIRVGNLLYPAPVNHDLDDRLEDALKVWDLCNQNRWQEARELAPKLGFSSPYMAQATDYRYHMPRVLPVELCTVSIGELGIAAMPYEIFWENARFIKDHSGKKETFVCACSQAYEEYVPARDCFPNGGYEVDMCRFPCGAAETFADEMVKMLRDRTE